MTRASVDSRAYLQQMDFLRQEIDKGRQAYIVYPLVEESEKQALKAAEAAVAEWQEQMNSHHGEFNALNREAEALRGSLSVLDQRMATALGHRVNVQSWPGRGSVFSLEVPVRTAIGIVRRPAPTAGWSRPMHT